MEAARRIEVHAGNTPYARFDSSSRLNVNWNDGAANRRHRLALLFTTMRITPAPSRLTIAFAVTTLLAIGIPPAALAAEPFQPLNSPATKTHLPGKFVWADLFTTDPVAATKFYSGLFGWTANIISQDGKNYTVFSNGSRPVAGLAPRPPSNTKRASRWIGYISVTDIASTVKRLTMAGGQVRAEARDFPDRGIQAIVADNEGSTIGLLQSASGDSADDEPKPGDWNWFVLYVKQPKVVSAFYRQVIRYEVAPDLRTERKDDFVLSSGGLARAGVAPLPAHEDAKPGWLGVIRVENIDEAIQRAEKLGGEILVHPRAAAYESRFAIIADSTGGTVGLVEYVDNANPAKRP